MLKVLVCGGAGYIGSHAVAALLERGYGVVVADNLEKGHREAVPPDAELVVGDLRDRAYLDSLFTGRGIDAVIDFAAYSLVGESMEVPLDYYRNNVYGTLNLLDAMRAHGTGSVVFSSTAATYGEPARIPIQEEDATCPTNAYGETKLAVEKMLRWADSAHGIKYAALRYFNVAGAHASGRIGEDHKPETHLIPNVLQVALGKRESLSLFGDDYNTADGTCVRDYIHVTDLADAHILALECVHSGRESKTFNLGNGAGFSNRQIIETAVAVTGREIPYTIAPRRPGDPASLVASSEKIVAELGWTPRFNTLQQIIETAWNWHKSHPDGYGS